MEPVGGGDPDHGYLTDAVTSDLAVDLSRLRAQLIEDKLAEHGIERSQVSRVRRLVDDVPGMAQESQRVDIVIVRLV